MKKMIAVLMFVLCATACIQDGAPLPRTDDAPDAMPPTEPDAPPPDAPPPVDCPPDAQPPAPTLNFTATPSTIVSGQSSTLSWSTTNATSCTYGATNGTKVEYPTGTTYYGMTCSGPGGSVTKAVIVTVTAPPPQCTCDNDCNDGYSWTGDACGSSGTCTHWLTDCGGMEVQLASGQTVTGSVTCGFWGGFNIFPPQYAPPLGHQTVTGAWMNSPTKACSVDECYDGVGTRVRVNVRIKWDGSEFLNPATTIYNLLKGTWDGKNTQQ